MSKEVLDEREFELVNIIGKDLGSNQRDLSRQLDLSLGQTNMLIRRLVTKGYIRISQLNKRKVQYLLTPKGLAEKMRKSIKYTLNTINSLGLINKNLRAILSDLHDQGERQFYVLGKSDLVVMVEMIFGDAIYHDCELQRINQFPSEKLPGIILIAQEEGLHHANGGNRYVNLLVELAKANDFELEKEGRLINEGKLIS